MERASPLRGDYCRDCTRGHGQPPYGRRPRLRRRRNGLSDVSARGQRAAAASRLRRQSRGGRRRNDRRRLEYAAGAGIRRTSARASPLRRDGRAGNGRAAAEPVLPGEAPDFHAVVTIVLALGLLAWAIILWQLDEATTGDVVLICTLGISVLHATRDLAVALVDITQHVARLSEALATLLVPHELRDHPERRRSFAAARASSSSMSDFHYPDGQQIFEDLNLELHAGRAHWACRPFRRRQIHCLCAAATFL